MVKTYIQDVANALANKHAALMVGAGFSKNAEKLSVTDKKFLNWNELSDLFYDEIYKSDQEQGKKYYSSLRLAQEVEVVSGRPKLEAILKDAIPDLDYGPSELYSRLLELPWVDVFTTNYDTLLERAADTITSRRYNTIVVQEDLVNSHGEPRIIKLHGTFPSHRPFIITEEDYREYPVRFAALVNTVQQSLLENVFCMIGFSCEDPNFIKWIGWIRDNLGKSSSQKIYMVAVNHIQEATSKLLFEQNIIVIDLQELWPEADIHGRLSAFFAELKESVDQEKRDKKWFFVENVPVFLNKKTLKDRTNFLHQLNITYPGWIFLPWEMKAKVDYVFQVIRDKKLFEKGSLEEQIAYMYEFVTFSDIAGRPLLSNDVDSFWGKLKDLQEAAEDTIDKVQTIYLQLLRAFRESAQWDRYDECRKKIQENCLNYDDSQLLFACDWWQNLYRFYTDGLVNKLDGWSLSKGDLYWPLVKSGMYSILGEFSKAEYVLSENLILVRKKLFCSEKTEYLSSIEASCVSLINFIRQRKFSNDNLEILKNCDNISWWDENERYYLHLNTEDRIPEGEKVNYDLSVTYTVQFGAVNKNFLYALEYLRFLEQTGHSFRLGNVVNTKGFEGTLKRLAREYPHWCLIHSLIAQDTKHMDLLFGRAQLAEKSQEYVDKAAEEYVRILQVLIQNMDPQNSFSSRSIFEQAAAVMPYILARLCYKCSVRVLDLIMETTFGLFSSNTRVIFKGIDKLLKGLIHSYTKNEQIQRIEKILMFPMEDEHVKGYNDPLNYMSKPERKVVLSEDVYNTVLYEIRRAVATNNSNQKNKAYERFGMLYQIIEMNQDDETWFFNLLEKERKPYRELFYSIKKDSSVQLAKEIFDDAMSALEADAKSTGILSVGGTSFKNAFLVIDDLDETIIDFAKAINVIKDCAKKAYYWAIRGDAVEAREQLRMLFELLVVLTVKKNQKDISVEERQAVSCALNVFEDYYSSPALHLFREDFVERQNNAMDALTNVAELWISEEKDLELLKDYYSILNGEGLLPYNCPESSQFEGTVWKYIIYQMLSNGDGLYLSTLKLCKFFLSFTELDSQDTTLLLLALDQMIGRTTISDELTEKEAIYKLLCRIHTCKIAQILYKAGNREEAVCKWKEISENINEFAEIRRIDFTACD